MISRGTVLPAGDLERQEPRDRHRAVCQRRTLTSSAPVADLGNMTELIEVPRQRRDTDAISGSAFTEVG